MAPRIGRKPAWNTTESEMAKGMTASGAMGRPRSFTTSDCPLSTVHAEPVRAGKSALATAVANPLTYGPKNTEITVVLNAELAQSYMAQPKISFLSFIVVFSVAITPPGV